MDRKKLLKTLFETLDPLEKGYLTVDEIYDSYNTTNKTEIIFRGEKFPVLSINDLLMNFLGYEGGIKKTDQITWKHFLSFYSLLSLTIPKNEFFEFFLRTTWTTTTTSSNGMNDPPLMVMDTIVLNNHSNEISKTSSMNSSLYHTSNSGSPSSISQMKSLSASFDRYSTKSPKVTQRRIIVTHSNDEEEVIDILDELGRTNLDEASMKQTLKAHGVHDIAGIRY